MNMLNDAIKTFSKMTIRNIADAHKLKIAVIEKLGRIKPDIIERVYYNIHEEEDHAALLRFKDRAIITLTKIAKDNQVMDMQSVIDLVQSELTDNFEEIAKGVNNQNAE